VTDDLGLFHDHRGEPRDGGRDPRKKKKRRSSPRRRTTIAIAAIAAFAIIAGGAWYGLTEILDIGSYEDYPGTGESDVIIEVKQGAVTGDIAAALREKDVVASSKAFVEAGEDNEDVLSVQPGYYVMKTKMSGKAAVDKITNKASRVGNLQIRAGTQLDDIQEPNNKVRPGIYSLLSKASCAELNGQSTCVPAEELRRTVETADLAALGVPSWAIADASKAEPKRRIEGLIMPGVYDLMPGSTAEELLKKLVTASSATLDGVGMPKISENTGFRPYEVLVMASLIEREAIKNDFPKVSRVTYNRLAKSMKLEYDSTINYVLDRPEVRTNEADRLKTGAYNTYANTGLPPTPISSPSKEALAAAAAPAEGGWLFFVKCEKNGLSCFAETIEQHDQNRADAQARGAY
jgi:UPF0755 protein